MRSSRHAFTLVELLIVIAIIALLSVVLILVLNPAETLRQARDSNRISDLSTLKTSIAFYETQGGAVLGNASTSYVSIFDPLATSSFGDQCQGLGLPSLPGGWTYQCAASSTFKNIDGTGWIPVNFTASQLKSPISQLPIDPVNTSSTGYYFTYTQNAGRFEITASLESQKYASTASADGGSYTDLYESGSNLALAPKDYAGGGGSGGGCAGGHNGYLCSRAITMNGSAVSGTLSSFPMLFSGTYSYLAASSSAGNVQNGNGYDIIFASDAGCSSKLNFETESYTSSTGYIVDWVNVPTITGGTSIYLCYGNSSVATNQMNATSTWNAGFVGVYHLGAGTALSLNDSTAAHNAVVNGSVPATSSQVGIGSSWSNNLSNFININYTGALNDFTACAWYRSDGSPASGARIIDKQYQVGFWMGNNAPNSWGGGVEEGSFPYGIYVTLPDGVFHFLCSVRSGTTHIISGDGGAAFASNTVSNAALSGDGTYIGLAVSLGNPMGNGVIDEMEISNVARSSQWILTEYNNQLSPSTFYSVGAAT